MSAIVRFFYVNAMRIIKFMVIYTPLLWFAAGLAVNKSLIVIHPRHRDDKPLLAHERCHQAQMKLVGAVIFWWRYLTDKSFRQAAEVEAYQVQIAHGAKRHDAARNLATMYRLGIDYVTAYELLKE